MDAALAGLAIALVPSFIVPRELRSDALKALNVATSRKAPTLTSRASATGRAKARAGYPWRGAPPGFLCRAYITDGAHRLG